MRVCVIFHAVSEKAIEKGGVKFFKWKIKAFQKGSCKKNLLKKRKYAEKIQYKQGLKFLITNTSNL